MYFEYSTSTDLDAAHRWNALSKPMLELWLSVSLPTEL